VPIIIRRKPQITIDGPSSSLPKPLTETLNADELLVASAPVADALDALNIVDVLVEFRLTEAEVLRVGVLVAFGIEAVFVAVTKGSDDTPASLQISAAMENTSGELVSTSCIQVSRYGQKTDYLRLRRYNAGTHTVRRR
jgi:hypothetical protein